MSDKRILYKPSPKMRQVYHESETAKHRVLEGAVRSGKSFVANDIAIKEIQTLPPCNVLISGYSISSVARNVIAELRKMVNPNDDFDLFANHRDGKDEYMTINWRGLRNKKFYVRGAGKEHDYKQIQGATFGYWLGDELTRHTESFFDMAISRLSLPFAKALWTCNPDHPMHYVKKRLIDNEDLYKTDENGFSNYRRWQFQLEDNPSLSQQYIDSLKRIYSGVFYKRYILGLWVLAEGSIYDFFDEDAQCISAPPDRKADYYVVGCDYGTADPTVFGLFGISRWAKPKIWLEKEYFYDSRVTQRQKSDAEYSADLRKWLQEEDPKKWPMKVIIPGDALSFKQQLINDGFMGIESPDMGPESVINGIRLQARMLKHGDYQIVKGQTKQTILDYSGYVWDEKALEKGEERPLHTNSHTKDMERYTMYNEFNADIVDYDQLTKW